MKRAASLHLHKYRRLHRAFLAEGADVVAAALRRGLVPEALFVIEGSPAGATIAAGGWPGRHDPSPGFAPDSPDVTTVTDSTAAQDLTAIPVTERVAQKVGTLQTPADVIAVFPQPSPAPLSALRGRSAAIVYADRLADPGNMGTLLRAAAAFGAAAVLTSAGSVDVWSPKVVRASMGAVFALPVCTDADLGEALEELGRPAVYGLAAHGGTDLRAARLHLPAVLCVGAERAGLSEAVVRRVDEQLTIALPGAEETGAAALAEDAAPGAAVPGAGAAVESLNAAVAASIALYEFSRLGGAPGASPSHAGADRASS